MKQLNKLVLLLSILFSIQSVNAQADKYISGQLFVKLQDTRTELDLRTYLPEKIAKEYKINAIKKPFNFKNVKLQQTYVIHFSEVSKTQSLINEIQTLEAIDYIERVPLYEIIYTPNDPFLNNQQWNINTVDGESAWDITLGNSNIVIGMVDDAVLLAHEDLQNIIWQNPGEIAGNGIDDDGNGYIDDVNGWDAANVDNDPNPVNPGNFSFSHGTHCAGIAAAETDNATGIASLGFGVSLMPVKIADDASQALTGAYDGVTYAMNSGANVISMSWGGGAYSVTYQNIFDQAYAMNIVCVAAAGNNNSSTTFYPAGYNHVISVGATDIGDNKASFSNYGSWVDIMAPGVNIYAPVATTISSYEYYDGTSMACPLVSGLAALMLSKDSNLTVDQIESCIKSTADDIYPINPGYNGQLGSGRINAYKALQCIKPVYAEFTSDYLEICPGGSVQFTDLSAPGPILTWQWSFPGGTPTASNIQNPTVSYANAGQYDVTLIVSNADGFDTLTKTVYLNVDTPTACLSGNVLVQSGSTANLQVYFSGNPPWDFSYTDGTNSYAVNGVTQNPYYLQVTPTDTTFYQITAMNDTFCSGNTCSDSAWVFVLPQTSSILCNFTKVYGDGNSNGFGDYYHDPILDEFFVCGSNNGNASLSKIQGDGTILWTQEYTGITTSFSDIELAPNGDLMLYRNANEDHYLMRVDNAGNPIWANAYDNARERFGQLVKSIGDSYIIGGWHAPLGSTDDFHFLRIDGAGNIITSIIHNGPGDVQTYEVISNGSGGVIDVGAYHGGGKRGFMAEYDVNGNQIQNLEINYSGGSWNEIFEVIRTKDGGYMTMSSHKPSGTNLLDILIRKHDAQFNIEWDTLFINTSSQWNGGVNTITQDNAGNYYFSFQASNGLGGLMPKIIKTDTVGNLISVRSFNEFTSARIKATNSFPVDNIAIMASLPVGQSYFGGSDAVLIRWDTTLASCIIDTATVNVTDYSFTTTSGNYTNSTLTMTTTPLTVTASNVAYQDSSLCDTCFSICQLQADFLVDTFVCNIDTVAFTDLSSDPFFTINYWEWIFGDGDTLIGVQHPVHYYGNIGAYNVTLVIGNDANPACYDTITQTVIVVDTFGLKIMPNDTICQYDSIQLGINLACGFQPLSYVWSPTAGLSNPFIDMPIASPDSSTTYIIIVTDSSGAVLIDSVEIYVDTSCCVPVADFYTGPEFCINELITIYDSSFVSGSASYSWSFGADAVPPTSNASNPGPISYTSGGIKTIILFVTDTCGTDSISKTVFINDLPPYDAGPDIYICGFDTVILGDTAFGGYLYQWSPITGLDDPNSPNPEAIITGSITYTVVVTDPFTGCSTTDTVNVFQSNGPTVDLGPDTVQCGASVLINSTSGTGTGYIWNTGATAPFINVTSSGVYSVTVTDGSGCTNSDDILVTLVPAPSVNLGSDIISCGFFNSAQLDAGAGSYTYTWSTGETTQSINVTQPGTYTVDIQDTLGCSDSDIIIISEIDNTLDLGPDIETCVGDSVILDAGSSGLSYIWQNGSNAQTFPINVTGTYSVTVDFGSGCTNTDDVDAVFKTAGDLTLEVSDDVQICAGESTVLSADVSGGELEWPDGSSGELFEVNQAGSYEVRAYNDCESTEESIRVTAQDCDCKFEIPNVFSPQNTDGYNDEFVIMFTGEKECNVEKLTIFNRWGKKIFEEENTNTWDGKMDSGTIVNHGVYYYVVLIDGVEYTGHVTRVK
jgi:gliding motility-associated-like protein